MSKNKYKGKIGFVFDKDLGINNSDRGHYVYVREDNGDILKINIITSLEDKCHKLNESRINKIKKGYLYPIPVKDTNLPRWSAFDLTTKTINKNKICDIDRKKVKSKHKWFVGKFSK